jgi:acetyl-CoA carboxylase carboxyl transferase subunit alpha
MTQSFDFEKPIYDLMDQMVKVKQVAEKSKVDVKATILELEKKIEAEKTRIYSNLSPWEKVQISRHPDRPKTLQYIELISKDFVELHGDRNFKDDKAMIGGFGSIDGETVMFIGHQKGNNTKLRQYRNFGMANPEGYRKALRLMKLAEKFNKPVIAFIDTPGAFPGPEAEERGQAEAIARNLFEMALLKVPILCFIIGEGASGGALGIGIGDKVYMLEYTWYSVISPESCSSILWKSWDFKQKASEVLKLTADDLLSFKLIDDIIREPLGGAHQDMESTAALIKAQIIADLKVLRKKKPEKLSMERIEKFSGMGVVEELNTGKI